MAATPAQQQNAKHPAYPLAGTKRFLHGGKDPSTDQKGNTKRGCSPERIGQQQQRGVSAGAAQRSAGQHQAQDRSGARRPQQSGRDTKQKGRRDRRALARCIRCRFRKTRAKRYQRTRQAIRQVRKQQRQSKHRQQHDGDIAPPGIGLHCPAAADCGERCYCSEGHGHANQQRQATAHEWLIGAREHERQDRQDAWAENGQHTTDIGQKKQNHEGVRGTALSAAIQVSRSSTRILTNSGARMRGGQAGAASTGSGRVGPLLAAKKISSRAALRRAPHVPVHRRGSWNGPWHLLRRARNPSDRPFLQTS